MLRFLRYSLITFFYVMVLTPCYADTTDTHEVDHKWYIKGSLGYSHSQPARFLDVNSNASNPPALFGPSRSAQGDFGSSALFEAGVGYRLTDTIRTELLIDRQPSLSYSGNANFIRTGSSQPVSADVTSNSILAAGFIDLPPLGLASLRPFIGAGVGVAQQHVNNVLFTFPGLSPSPDQTAITRTLGGNYTGLAYMLSVGIAWELSNNTTIDLAYRYTDLGKVETSAGPANIDWHPHGAPPHLLSVAAISAPLRTQSVLLSVRYAF